MKKLSTSRGTPVKLPHPLFFQHTVEDGRTLTFRSPMPYRLQALNEFWTNNDFQLERACPACPKEAAIESCSLCKGAGVYQVLSNAESVERTEKVICAMLGSFWADGQYILESEYKGDMDLFALEVSFEIMGGDHALTWTDCSAIFAKCTTVFMGQLYPKSKSSSEVQKTADFLSPPKDTTTSSPSTSESAGSEETPSDSSSSTPSDSGSSSHITESGPATTSPDLS